MIKIDTEFISTRNFAQEANISIRTIQRKILKGEIEAVKSGKNYKIPKKNALEWLEKKENKDKQKRTNKQEESYRSPLDSSNDLSLQGKNINEEVPQDNGQTRPRDEQLNEQFKKFGFERDEKGIYIFDQKGKNYLTNFSRIEFVANKTENNERVRIIKINDILIELRPHHLQNYGSLYKKLLGCSKFHIDMPRSNFLDFVNLLLNLDNDKFINPAPGFGRINDSIYNLGNKLLVNGDLRDHQKQIWLGQSGYMLDKTDMINISDKKIELLEIWKSLYGLYEMQAILVVGFGIATLFFQQYMERKKHFPLLYILAASGRGKNGLSDLICSLFGLNESLVNINCVSNSTKIGMESKSLLLHNLPLVLNEVSEDQFDFIKSRFDGQGSVKYKDNNTNNIEERSVNGSTIVTTVVDPLDKQIVSRCIFINLDITELNKELFDSVRDKSVNFSSFIIKVLQSMSFEDILEDVENFRKNIKSKIAQPRIVENYSLIGGCFNAFRKLIEDSEVLPDQASVNAFIEEQMETTEQYLNPLIYFIRELERLADVSASKNYLVQDNDFVYFNFNGIWSLIKDSYKTKHFPFMKDKNIKRLLEESDYMAVYGVDIDPPNKNMLGKPISSYIKKIGVKTRRCFVLRRDKLPGYYR